MIHFPSFLFSVTIYLTLALPATIYLQINCFFSDRAECGENQDLKEQKGDSVDISELGNTLGLTLTPVHIHSLRRHFRHGPYPGKPAEPAPAGAPQVRIWPGQIYFWTKC